MTRKPSRGKPRKKGWDKHRIKAEINRRGETLRSLEDRFDLSPNTLSVSLLKRFPRGDEVIAAFLQIPLYQLWPDRYDEDGFPIRQLRCKDGDLTRAQRNRHNQALARQRAREQERQRASAELQGVA